jgi:[ribosomal protein S5]-alanine N-acetyltransferase
MITEESFIDFQCPYCDAGVSFPQDNAGFAQACPQCNESLIVPDDGSEVGKRLPIPIETPRLVIRRFALGDWQDLIELHAVEELFQYTPGRALSEEEALRWLESDAHVKLTTPNQTFFLGMETRDPAKLIGYIGLTQTDPARLTADLSIFVNKAFQRKGFALEALEAVVALGFKGVKLHRLTASCDSGNVAARGLFEKLGLRREGEFLKDHILDGQWANTTAYAALREDYDTQASMEPAGEGDPKAAL